MVVTTAVVGLVSGVFGLLLFFGDSFSWLSGLVGKYGVIAHGFSVPLSSILHDPT
ncbi:hypothetical protein BDV59DRAFT_171098 [Aspergillus ambiguus]|uniref:uncharacterized protein n=1 Tax=Aspergillus ambiguus TaxID=176160 RepID=UPI003CCDF468